MAKAVVFLAVMVMFALSAPDAEATITCNTVANGLRPCINFVIFGGNMPPLDCCNGIRSLYNEARATADRQSVCSCLKSVAGSATPNILNNAASLPGKCGINIPYKISPSVDCSKVR